MTGPGGGRHLYVRGRLESGQLVSHLLLPAWNVILAGNGFQRRSCPAATSVGEIICIVVVSVVIVIINIYVSAWWRDRLARVQVAACIL